MVDAQVATSRSPVAPLSFGVTGRAVRAGMLLLLMAAELVHCGIPLLPTLNPTLRGWWWPLIWNGRPLGEAAIGGLLAAIFLSWPVFREELETAFAASAMTRLNFWLGVHLLCVALTVTWLALGMAGGTFTPAQGALWFLAGSLILPLAAVTWCGAIVEHEFWLRWLRRSPGALVAGLALGIFTRSAGHFAQMLWPPLQHYTFVIVGWMLLALGLPLMIDPKAAVIGTAHFAVRIAPACSGLEGIALICAFMAAYLWLYRADYRFPAALALIPAGVALIWISNACRITLLILIGQWFDRVAVTGFHTVAGWIFFNLTAIGVLSASRRVAWFTRTGHSGRDAVASNPVSPWLAPLMATIAVAMLTAPFAHSFDPAYPIRVIVTGLALWWYRDRIACALLQFSWVSVGLGALACVIWIALTRGANAASSNAAFAAGLHGLPIAAAAGWMLFRLAGAVITVPIAEELAFRGYLLRKLIAPDFETVALERFTWLSFLGSSVLFGLLHQDWIAGSAAGMIFAVAMYRKGRLSDAIAAHATANALLALYVIATGSWSLWI